jgi:multidrug efflux pump subunit AcrB
MALSIPITLAMTFGMMHLLGIDLQQISIASLIIALGLLVDDPVVAGDAIKRDLSLGHKPIIASWLGPVKLATAILFATITNIVAYLPFLLLEGDPGKFLHSLAVVMTCALVASRLVSMTFIPLLGYYLLKPKAEPTIEERRKSGFAAWYYKVGGWAIDHRWKVFVGSLAFIVLGGLIASTLKPQFFPKDLSYLSYVDVWLPNDVPLIETNKAATKAEQIIREVTDEYSKEEEQKTGKKHDTLKSLTTFVGGGGPRFWFSVSPELQQLNYAQIIIQVQDKHDTNHLVDRLQAALSAGVPGARIDVRQLESGGAVGIPVSIRLSGEDIATLRKEAEKLKQILRDVPVARRVRDDWGGDGVNLLLDTYADRANLAGITNQDVANSSASATTGQRVTSLREGDKQIPVVAKMRMEERTTLSDLENLYVGSSQSATKVPITEIASMQTEMRPEKLRRRKQFRTVTVSAFPNEGHLPSEVLMAAMPKIKEFESKLPVGYHVEIGGEFEEQQKGFKSIAKVMAISIVSIFLALVIQFRNAIKPFIVFAAIPYGIVGALAALYVTGTPFGFMAFLGIASLVGVIVSHVIVLFDFIEEAHERGESLRESLLDAGIVRLRPVLITVGATVIALFPLAAHGGPLWEPLCYAQIGGLSVATVITLILVPVIYAIVVLDLKWVKWEKPTHEEAKPAVVSGFVEAQSA